MLRYHIRKIAIATNFSEEADNSLTHAAMLAQKHLATLDIIHAVSPSDSRNKKAYFVNAAYEKLKIYKSKISEKYSIEAKVFSRVGETAEFIYKYCIDNAIDLLIIGIQNGIKRYFKDSKAYEIIMKVECPVLTIPVHFTKTEFYRILFPVRDVKGVKEKLVYSKPFIEKYSSELHMTSFGQPDPARVNELIELARDQEFLFSPSDFQTTSQKSIPFQVIAAAKEKNDDLIVINATSEKEWYNIFGENYTEYILREADIAVLSITHLFESKSEAGLIS